MINNEENFFCLCCLLILTFLCYKLVYGNPNLFEGYKCNQENNDII